MTISDEKFELRSKKRNNSLLEPTAGLEPATY